MNSKRKSLLVDAHGRPMSSFLYPTPRFNLRQYKPRFWLSADTKSNVGSYDRWELVNYSRQLFAQIGNLSTAIKEKNSWAFADAWDPHYGGRNVKWGEEAADFLKNQFYPMACVRGPIYDFKRCLRLSGQAWDTDGDDLMVLTESQSGFPQVAFFPATRIGGAASGTRGSMAPGAGTRKGMGGPEVVSGGAYDGAKFFDGIIYDRNDRMIAVRVSDGEGFRDISSFNGDLAYEPDWADQGRGIPRPATCLLRWMDLQDIDDFLRRGMKRAASIGLKFKKEEGEAGVGNEVVTGEVDPNSTPAAGETTRQIYYEEIEGGEMYYLTANSGEEIEALDYKNPHQNSEAFVERVVRECLASIGWRYELMVGMSTGRIPRLVCDIANQNIWDRQSAGEKRWKRAITYAIAKAMKNGLISRNDDGIDPYLWTPGLPKILSVDAGNEEQADRENLKLGTTSKAIIAQKKGLYEKDIAAQRDREVRDLIARAKAIHDDNPVVPFEKVMELLEQRTPNGQIGQTSSLKPQASPGQAKGQ